MIQRIALLTCPAVVLALLSCANANRKPVDDEIFAEISDFHAYDPGLPLHAEVIGTQTHDGRKLPYLTDKVHFRTIHDDEVIGYFAYPEDSTGARYPTVILLHGNNGYRGSQSSWSRSWLDILPREGYCVLTIDQYGHGERFVPEMAHFFTGMDRDERRDLLRRRIVDVRRAIDFVHSRPEVDTTRIALHGASMGGGVALRAAALDDRLACLILEITGSWRGADTHDLRFRDGHPLNFAPRVSAPVLMISSDLSEVLGMADRILVMHEGRLGGELDARTASQEQILRLAMGDIS